MNQGFLKTIVLKHLADESLSGYTLVKRIHETTGWKPSFGSIYPLLQHLEKDSHVKVTQQGRSKVYSITDKGALAFKEETSARKNICNTIVEHLRCLASMGDEEAGIMADMLGQTTNNDLPFHTSPELLQLRKELYRLMKEHKTVKPKFKATIATTIKSLKKL